MLDTVQSIFVIMSYLSYSCLNNDGQFYWLWKNDISRKKQKSSRNSPTNFTTFIYIEYTLTKVQIEPTTSEERALMVKQMLMLS